MTRLRIVKSLTLRTLTIALLNLLFLLLLVRFLFLLLRLFLSLFLLSFLFLFFLFLFLFFLFFLFSSPLPFILPSCASAPLIPLRLISNFLIPLFLVSTYSYFSSYFSGYFSYSYPCSFYSTSSGCSTSNSSLLLLFLSSINLHFTLSLVFLYPSSALPLNFFFFHILPISFAHSIPMVYSNSPSDSPIVYIHTYCFVLYLSISIAQHEPFRSCATDHSN